jgi:endoglucanase
MTGETAGLTPVERYGRLKVDGTQLVDAQGRPVVLRGISSHGIQWFADFLTKPTLAWLRDDVGITVFRVALYTEEGGYVYRPELIETAKDVIRACKELGLYCIIDNHILHHDGDPRDHLEEAAAMFKEICKEFGNWPGLLIEIANEPNSSFTSYEVTWDIVKEFAYAIIPVIRTYTQAPIIIGTPRWSQDVDIAALSPVTGFDDLLYALHWYAGSHGSWLREKAELALQRGLPLFVSEWGFSEADGGRSSEKIFEQEALAWIYWMEKRGISWVNWSLSNKNEASAFLASSTKSLWGWTPDELSPSGRLIRQILHDNEPQMSKDPVD